MAQESIRILRGFIENERQRQARLREELRASEVEEERWRTMLREEIEAERLAWQTELSRRLQT